jgi:hypothetical protein
VLALAAAGCGAAAADEALERERIGRERAEAQTTFEAAKRACQARFAVTACVDEALAERRATLQRLKAQESVIDSEQRKRRAAERQQAIERKLAEREARLPEPAASMPRPTRALERRPSAASAPGSRVRPPAVPSPEREAEEARARESYEARQREIARHRAEAERRNAERAAHGKKPAPLPVPAASAPR